MEASSGAGQSAGGGQCSPGILLAVYTNAFIQP